MPTSSTRRILLSEIAATPWKNGGGVTREIATGPTSGKGADWGWRVSLAEVAQDGPFSVFPDIDRVIAVIDGAGMDLVAPDGAILALDPFQPVRFAGEAPLSGRLRGGPVRDLNAMVRRGLFAAEMEVLQGPRKTAWQASGGGCLLVHSLAGRCSAAVDGGKAEELAPSETLVHEGPGSVLLELTDSSRAAVILVGQK